MSFLILGHGGKSDERCATKFSMIVDNDCSLNTEAKTWKIHATANKFDIGVEACLQGRRDFDRTERP